MQAFCNVSQDLKPLHYSKCSLSLTEVTVVEFAWLNPDSGAGAEVDAQTNHVVQLEV